MAGKGVHPNSLKNLELGKFKPGEKHGGRPKGALSLKERMAKFIDLQTKVKMPDGSITDATVMESIILSLLAQAAKGNINAIKEVLDRNFGKEAQPVELTGKDGQPIEIEHSRRLSEVYERAAEAFGAGCGLSDEGPAAK